jgi:hypothetical protein
MSSEEDRRSGRRPVAVSEIDTRALIAHEERGFQRRQVEIDAAVIPPTQGGRYQPTVEKRLEWARDFFERHDYLQVIDQAGRVLAMSATPEQRMEAEGLRRRAERAQARFGDELVRPAPVEPTWR